MYRLPVAAPIARLGQKTLPVFVAHLPVLLVARAILPGLGGVIAPVVLAILSIAGSLMVERIAIAAGAGWLYARPGWASAVAARHMMEQLPRLAAQWVRPAV